MFDKDGNLVQWWSEDVIHKFKQQAQCIVDQYSNYTVEEVGMNVSTIWWFATLGTLFTIIQRV